MTPETVAAAVAKIETQVAIAEELATAFELTPRHVRALAQNGTLPKASRGKFPLVATIRAWGKFKSAGAMVDDINPDRMEPFKRRAWLQGEREKIALRQQAGELMLRIEHEQILAALIKVFLQPIETLADRLERDAGLTPRQLEVVDTICNEARLSLYEVLGTEPLQQAPAEQKAA